MLKWLRWMRNISANLSKEQKLHRSLLNVQGLLFQIKKLLTVQNNCGDFFFVWFLLVLIFCVEVYIMRKFSAQTQILFLPVCPNFYGSAGLDFSELKCRCGARVVLKIITIFITNTVLPEVCVRDGWCKIASFFQIENWLGYLRVAWLYLGICWAVRNSI